MAVSETILGMNARNYLYIKQYNSKRAKTIADNKLLTKRILLKQGIPTAPIKAIFTKREHIRNFNWDLPTDGFVIKPARGYAGIGIMAFKKWYGTYGITMSDKEVDIAALETHLLDILDGAYSLQNLPDMAFVEDLVSPSPFYSKLTPVGLPDLRLIVLNHIPVMAMIRLPTIDSGGKANLMQGALGIGIDIATGITTKGYYKYEPEPKLIPGTKIKVRGLKIPQWQQILELAVAGQDVTGLGFAGVDIVVDKELGPLIMEVNARPGLSIQSVNDSSLRTRLERVANLQHVTPKRGVELGKTIFAEAFSDKVSTKPTTITLHEDVLLKYQSEEHTVPAIINPNNNITQIDQKLATKLGLDISADTIELKRPTSTLQKPATKLTYQLKNRTIKTTAAVNNLSKSSAKIIIGNRDLKNFVIKPTN